jgi:SAM-dependent methyltransferase
MADNGSVESDFDKIALLPTAAFDNNAYYHQALLRSLPGQLGEALDVGCGTGAFTRLLAARADRVLGLDLSANMISVARQRSAGFSNIDFCQADAVAWTWPAERFDCIVSIATLHHLSLNSILPKMKAALRPGGTLAILDICRSASLPERLLVGAVAFPVSLWLNVVHTGRRRPDPVARRLWCEHGKTDRYLSIDEVRRTCRAVLPGAVIHRHLLWRYSLIWRRP